MRGCRDLVWLALSVLMAVSCSETVAENSIPASHKEDKATLQASCVRPDYLKQGDTVALVTPSGDVREKYMTSARKLLRSWGLVPVDSPNFNHIYPAAKDNLGGSAGECADDIRWALENKNIKAIICANGGYGVIRHINLIPLSLYTENPKWIVGFSDITTLLSVATMSGVMSIHGPTAAYFTDDEETDELLRRTLFGDLPEYDFPYSEYNVPGKAEGMLVGGNLFSLCALCGSDYDITTLNGTILFIEETEEPMSSLDEELNTLFHQEKLGNIKGIIFGYIEDSSQDLPYKDSEAVLSLTASRLGVPVAFGFKGGHSLPNSSLIIGAKVTLDVTDNGTKITYCNE